MKIIVEGCVAAGKTAVLSELARLRPSWIVAPEPIERFEEPVLLDGSKAHLLKAFYDHPDSSSVRRLQAQIILALCERYVDNPDLPDVPVLYERSVKVAREVFLEESKSFLDATDLTFLVEFALLAERTWERDTRSIYLVCSDHSMLERFHLRCRGSEERAKEGNLLCLKERMDRWAEDNCDLFVDTDDMTVKDVAREIEELISEELFSKACDEGLTG